MTIITLVSGWILGWLLLWRMPRLASATPDPRRVCVVIPMRNEVDRIPMLLESLAGQDRPAEQIIVVDDGSEDGSADAARRFTGVQVITAPPIPAGWTGKSWACAHGVRHADADADTLVFLDADVVLTPNALARVLRTLDERSGLVSVQPHHRIGRPVEALSLLFNVISVMGLGIASVIRPKTEWGAAGPCLATSLTDYRRVGGHRAVGGSVAEDLALAHAYRKAGMPVSCVGGGDQISYRMYRNLRDLYQGWTKNITTGAGRTPLLRRLAIAWWVAALLSMLIVGTESLTGSTPWWVGALVYGAAIVQIAVLGRRVGRFAGAAIAWPFLVIGFAVIFVSSAIQTLVLGRTSWSGRTILIGSRRSATIPAPQQCGDWDPTWREST